MPVMSSSQWFYTGVDHSVVAFAVLKKITDHDLKQLDFFKKK